MAKLGDLFVKLGLKADEFKKGIDEAKRDTEGFGGKLKSMSTIAKASWAAVAAAVTKFCHDAIKMTQTWGDQWAIQMEGVKGAYGAFVRQLSSGEGWDNLFKNMVEAARIAKEVAASMDEIFERKVSLGYEEAQTNKTISELQLIMRDASKSDEERMEAARQIIALEKQLGKTKRSIAQQEADAQKQLFMSQTGLNEKETEYLLKNYNINRDSINQAREYLAEKKRLEGQLASAQSTGGFQTGSMTNAIYSGKAAQEAQDALKKLDAQTSDTIKNLAALTQKYDKSNDDLVNNMANAEVAVINVDTEINRASMRATAMLGSLTEASNRAAASGSGSGSSEDPGLASAKRIQQRAEDAAKTEMQLLIEKYDAEKALLEKYGLDTEALTAEFIDKQTAILTEGLDDMINELEEIEPVEIDPIEIDTSSLDEFIAKLEHQTRLAEGIAHDFNRAVIGGFSDGCQELMNQLMGVSESNPGAVIKALLEPLADMAVRTGEIIMAEGLAVEAAKFALLSFGGIGAIAAGAALIAIGTAAKAGLSALASNGAATTAAGAGSSPSSGSSTQNIESEMTIYVTGRISGSDIIISGAKTANSWGR